MPDLTADLRYSARTLRRSPGFSLTAIAAIALGIGASTAIFSVVNKVLLEPLPYPEPDRLVQLTVTSWLGDQTIATIPQFLIWRDLTRVFRYVAAYDIGGPGVNLTRADGDQSLAAARVSAGYFQMLGAKLKLGQSFTAAEDRPGSARTVVISDRIWRKDFGGDSTILDRRILLEHEWYKVIGVLAPGFHTDSPVDVWLPLQADKSTADHVSRVRVIARLQPGATLEKAQDAVNASLQTFAERYPFVPLLYRTHFTAIPLRDAVVGNVRPAFVLLISCANVANLLLARSTRRARDLALRAALGAQRQRIVRELLTESILLALAGGAAGLALGYLGVRALLAVSPGEIPRIDANGAAITLDWRVFIFALAVSLLTGVLFGLMPALTASRTDIASLVKDTPAQAGMGFRRNRARSLLVIAELGLALVLLVGAGLLIRTFVEMRTVNRGFDENNVLTMQMSLASPEFEKTKPVAQLVRATVRRIEHIPGVSVVAATSALPLEHSLILPFTVPSNDHMLVGIYDGVAEWRAVSSGYFDAFRIRLMRGRMFDASDDAGAPPVVLINRMMMKKYWNQVDANPIGEFITIGKRMGIAEEPPRQIIGVLADVRDSGFNREPMMYVPLAQVSDAMNARNNRLLPITWVVRAEGSMPLAAATIQQELREVSGGLPLDRVRSMHEVVAASSARAQFYMLLLSIFAAIALLLAAVGLYGVMAYSVQQRTQEIGIRMALGAAPADVRSMVLGQGMRLAFLGILVGIPIALALTRVMVSLIFGIATWDPAVFAAVTLLLSAVALFATYLPSVRATTVDPAIALRC